uniref:Protein YIPF n=1 Tax=Pavo cristatus TaxID=9049 RepID=A0A8C9ENG3_PAVCR
MEGMEPGSSPHLRVGSGGEGISLEISAYLRPSKGKQLFSFTSVSVAAAFGFVLIYYCRRLWHPAVIIPSEHYKEQTNYFSLLGVLRWCSTVVFLSSAQNTALFVAKSASRILWLDAVLIYCEYLFAFYLFLFFLVEVCKFYVKMNSLFQLRDLKAVGKKFVHVMYPKKSSTLLRDWDLWGPLVLCVSLALMLQGGSADSKEDGGPQFAEVFVIIWFGAVVITLNSKLLGGTISFFQSLCVLGYCVLPLTVAMLVCRLVLLAGSGTVSFIIRLIVVMAMFAWSTLASTAFLADSQPPHRKALVVYPIFLFYFVISWMILTFTPQ